VRRRRRSVAKNGFALAIAGTTALAILAGCHGLPWKKGAADGGDASADGGDARARFDANLPDTVTIILEAGVEPDGRITSTGPKRTITLMSGLPQPCTDKALGVVTFAQDDEKVVITTSKGKARATCTRVNEHKLLCDWVDKDGKPTVQSKPVTYGPKTKIGGNYDAKHAFSCPAQR
jgi:hypothetical protein